MNWTDYFISNEVYPEVDWHQPIELPDEIRTPLANSLRRFQIGESGDGNHLKAAARSQGPEYAQAMELFIQEEQSHARMLASIVEALGHELMTWHWSDLAFIVLRRLMGLRQELMTLLIAELIAKVYYRALNEGVSDPILNSVFGRICRDEEAHIAFHLDTLNGHFQAASFLVRSAIYLLWRLAFSLICLVVLLDHGRLLGVLGVSRLQFWRECRQVFEDAAWIVFRPKRTLLHASLTEI